MFLAGEVSLGMKHQKDEEVGETTMSTGEAITNLLEFVESLVFV